MMWADGDVDVGVVVGEREREGKGEGGLARAMAQKGQEGLVGEEGIGAF